MGFLCDKCASNWQEIEELAKQGIFLCHEYINPWYPIGIRTWRSSISKFFTGKRFIDVKNQPHNPYANIVSNISYNLQYLEYIEECIKQQVLTAVIIRQNIKTYCVIGGSVIESLLLGICGINIVGNRPSFSKLIEKYLIEKDDSKKVYDWERGIMGERDNLYKMIDYVRKMRDNIHLYVDDINTDYQNYSHLHLGIIKYVIGELIYFKRGFYPPYFQCTAEEQDSLFRTHTFFGFGERAVYMLKKRFESFEDRNKNR